jgi:hypothetical protein
MPAEVVPSGPALLVLVADVGAGAGSFSNQQLCAGIIALGQLSRQRPLCSHDQLQPVFDGALDRLLEALPVSIVSAETALRAMAAAAGLGQPVCPPHAVQRLVDGICLSGLLSSFGGVQPAKLHRVLLALEDCSIEVPPAWRQLAARTGVLARLEKQLRQQSAGMASA